MMTAKSSSVINANLHSDYDNNWNILDERVTHSQTKNKVDYDKSRSPKPKNNRLECEIKNTVWNSINKKDIITQNIEYQCKKFDDGVTSKIDDISQPQREENDKKVVIASSSSSSPSYTRMTSFPRSSLFLTKAASFKEETSNNQSGGGHNRRGHLTTVVTSSNVQDKESLLQPTQIVKKMNRINHFDPANVKIEIISSGSNCESSANNINDTNNRFNKDTTNNKLSVMTKLMPLTVTPKYLLCYRCKEIVYTKELLEPRKGVIFHDRCFRCEDCGLKLTLKTFVANQKDHEDPRVYCKNHAPQLEAGKMDHTAKFISSYQQVPKVPTFNGQIRGPDAGKVCYICVMFLVV